MNYQSMKKSHQAQIEAILADDYETLANLYGMDMDDIHSHHMIWGNTEDIPGSLFASLPGCGNCLTEVQYYSYREENLAGGMKLGLKSVSELPHFPV